MSDLISRQAALDALEWKWAGKAAIDAIKELPSAQPETCEDAVSREEAKWVVFCHRDHVEDQANAIDELPSVRPSAQPTLCGYDIEHLELIARVLQKEDLPPERVAEALTDIGRIVAIVRDEFEETLRKAVEQCKI